MRPPLHIHLLGDFLLLTGETPVTTITIPRVQSLLAYLILHRQAPQDRSHLAFLFWPDSTEGQAHTNLRQLLYHLRQLLPNAHQFLQANKQSLQWSPEAESSFSLDTQEMEQAQIRAKQAEQVQDMVEQREALEQVMRLYRGELLPGCYEEWILPERDRLRQMFLSAAQRLIVLLEQERDYDAAINAALLLLRQDPLHEETYRQLMRLYALHGDRISALRTYHTCARLLERELGAGPSEITQAIYESLMQSEHSFQKQELPKQRTEAPLEGRKAEWRQLQKVWNTVTGGITGLQAGQMHMVILTGEAGIGKTRLARELEVWVGRQGMTTASARCYATLDHLAYAPITTWLNSDALKTSFSALDPTTLTEIARLVPEVLSVHPRLSTPRAMTEGWQRQHFFAALAHAVLSVRQPLLLLLDDLQWCDQETLEWLQYLFHSTPEARLLLVGTIRAGETLPPLVAFLGALQRDRLVTEIPLEPLTPAETTSLAEAILDSQLGSERSRTLYLETEGNPFFVVEMARAEAIRQGEETPASRQESALLTQSTSSLPPAIQAVFTTRLAQLSPQAREVADVAAIIGREFSFFVLAHASGESEEYVVRGLDELWQRRMVREQDAVVTNAYDFSHEKLREHLLASLSPTRRRLLHRRVAEAFKMTYSENLASVYGQIATHYEQANLPMQAIPFYQQAGEAASRIYANAEALHAFRQATTLLDKLNETHLSGQGRQSIAWEIRIQVYVSLGDACAVIGSYEDARQAYQQAMLYIPEEAILWLARLHWKIATTWKYASTKNHDIFHIHAQQGFEEAEHLLLQIADPASPEWREEWITLQFAQIWPGRGSLDDMVAAIEKARPIIEAHGTREQRKLLAEMVGMYQAMRSRYVISAERVAIWRATIASMEPTENEAQRGIEQVVLGIGLLCASQFEEAEEQLSAALQVGERTGNAWLHKNCLTFLPFIFRHRGQVEEMRRILAQARSVGVAENNSMLMGQSAWVAWRDRDLTLAESYGRESVEEEQYPQIRYNPFLWVGRWPLIGVALSQGRIEAAIEHVRLLFDPIQQPPPEPLVAPLEAALQAWDAGLQEEAVVLLQQVMPLAEKMGFL